MDKVKKRELIKEVSKLFDTVSLSVEPVTYVNNSDYGDEEVIEHEVFIKANDIKYHPEDFMIMLYDMVEKDIQSEIAKLKQELAEKDQLLAKQKIDIDNHYQEEQKMYKEYSKGLCEFQKAVRDYGSRMIKKVSLSLSNDGKIEVRDSEDRKVELIVLERDARK